MAIQHLAIREEVCTDRKRESRMEAGSTDVGLSLASRWRQSGWLLAYGWLVRLALEIRWAQSGWHAVGRSTDRA